MLKAIPAPGYQKISGKRNPPDGEYWVQLRNGWCDMQRPWPAKGPVWVWGDKESPADVVAVKKV